MSCFFLPSCAWGGSAAIAQSADCTVGVWFDSSPSSFPNTLVGSSSPPLAFGTEGVCVGGGSATITVSLIGPFYFYDDGTQTKIIGEDPNGLAFHFGVVLKPNVAGTVFESLTVTGTNVTPVGPLTLVGTGLPPVTATQSIAATSLTVNQAVYFTPVTGSGGTAPLSYSISPALPAGLSFGTGDGGIYGTPTVASATTIYTVTVTDANGATATATFSLTVNQATLTPATSPIFTPGSGAYTSPQSVTISDATPGATIYYTTNGTTPSTSSTQYTGAITVSSTETIEAIAVASGYSNSAAASATYTISSNALQFIPITPCRVVDTRNPNGPFGGPELGDLSTREFDIPQSACGIPSNASAYSLNVTVVPTAGLPEHLADRSSAAAGLGAELLQRTSGGQRGHRACRNRPRGLRLCDQRHGCGPGYQRLLRPSGHRRTLALYGRALPGA